MRGGQIDDIAKLLRQGVRVALIYGDADYIVSQPTLYLSDLVLM